MSIPKDAKYLLDLAEAFINEADGKEGANRELLGSATKSFWKVFGRRALMSAKGVAAKATDFVTEATITAAPGEAVIYEKGVTERYVEESTQEQAWRRRRSVELRRELEKELDIAEKLTNEAKAIDPSAKAASGLDVNRALSAIYYVKGNITTDAGDLRPAWDFYEKADGLSPNPQLYFAWGLSLEAKNPQQAIEKFSKGVKMAPRSNAGFLSAMEIRRLQYRR